MPENTLYANAEGTRFFLIPDDARPPKGKLTLRSLSGKRLDVKPKAVARYEIPEDQAQEEAAAEMDRVAQKAKGVVSGIGGVLRQVAKNQRDPEYRPPERSPREATVADALGVTEEQLRDDPDAVKEGVMQVLDGLKRSVTDALAGEPADDETTRARVRALATAVGVDPNEAEGSVDEIREKLHAKLADPELTQKVQEATKQLEGIAAELREKRKGGGS